MLTNGNLVVSTPLWSNGDSAQAGAVTWINGTTGLAGLVSAENSFVGTTKGDSIGGYDGVVALTNGNYVIASPGWSNTDAANAGAVTWGDGYSGSTGVVSASNSLVGTEANDEIGQDQTLSGSSVVPLPNGNYVVPSSFWHYATRSNYGAVSWGSGVGGTVGLVSAQNSLLQTTDCLSDTGSSSQIIVLRKGSYLVASPCWNQGETVEVGAVTKVDGSKPTSGQVAPENSLVGQSSGDMIGSGRALVLNNGNYVVLSPSWNGGLGAATWIDGTIAGLTGVVSASNSLVGSTSGDYIGMRATALSNGNYVVGSWSWSNSEAANVGAATWGNGLSGISGQVSPANSLVGATENDAIGFTGITALRNGNYVLASPFWSNAQLNAAGAVTLVDGNAPAAGLVTTNGSLTGSHANDQIGNGGITVLSGGRYVIASPAWNNGAQSKAGAVTFSDGSTMLSGTVSSSNSLVGVRANESVGSAGVVALASGNYVVASDRWSNGDALEAGAVTWADGVYGRSGVVSPTNSLVGTHAYEHIGLAVTGFDDGNYLVAGAGGQGGYSIESLTLGDGHSGTSGSIQAWNTLIANIGYASPSSGIAYYAPLAQLIVGQPSVNVVTLFCSSECIFANGFESPLRAQQTCAEIYMSIL
ncbi:MAG: hypothetical protein ABI305_05140 [Tepidiformaceae bacterium]